MSIYKPNGQRIAFFVLNLEWKALKIAFKIVSLPTVGGGAGCPLFEEDSGERGKTR